ncbi:hypothetical protein M9H77_22474 [Catharanthus roseus]|uniref:Uncharacterized protein n=1 Tax=Catharanthus roseus TaxID=4058 RepID=A0ACC0AUL2_CATRO|nr:hypothetical protein M9H77_22474 [Catharanthus roseus]
MVIKLYSEREHWVLVYLNHMFWTGMLSTQRSESMHSFFDGYLLSTSTPKQFLEQYEIAVKHKVEKEVYVYYKLSNILFNCGLFECSGLLCAHTIKIASIKRVNRFPKRYVLRRWRKDVLHRHSRIFFDEGYPHMTNNFEKIKDVKKAFNEIVDLVIASPGGVIELQCT